MKFDALLLGAAVSLAPAAALSEPLPIAEPAEQYVRICDAFGAGFFYIPGTDTCLRLGGYVRAEYHYVGGDIDLNPNERFNNVTSRAQASVTFDARTSADVGLIRTYIEFEPKRGPRAFTGPFDDEGYIETFEFPVAFVEITSDIGVFTAGHTGSFFDFYGSNDFGTRIDVDDSTTEQTLFAYTFVGPSHLKGTLSVENPDSSGRRLDGLIDDYVGMELPDLVGSIRIDQDWGSAQVMAVGRHIHDEDGDGLGWAAGAGLSLNLPINNNVLAAQIGYADGALAYITTDPGGIGDFFVPDGQATNRAWMARGGLLMPFEIFDGWIDGSFTRVERADDKVAYEFWAFVVGAAWKPNDNLSMGPEFGYNNIIADGADVGFETWGTMWRVQADF